jgi:Flp pilus assembly protein CpaB
MSQMRGTLSRYRLRNTAVAGGLALAGAILVFLYVVSYRNDVQSGANLVDVFVAARDIPEGMDGATAIGGGYLEKSTVLKRNVIGGAISDPGQLSDLAASHTIVAGEQISVRQFHSVAQKGVLANISGNRRAMTIPGGPNQLLSGIVNEGDRVDVLANIEYIVRPPAGVDTAEGDLSRVATRVVLRDLLVLEAPGGSSDGGIASSDEDSITLALSDSQAQKMLFAMNNGDWWLVLRPVAKPADSPESVETIESLLADGLGPRGIQELTGGYGSGSIGSGG